MNTFLNILNFVGVLALVGLCAVQWQHNGRLNQRIDELEQTGADQETKLVQQGQTLKADAADLADLHQRLDHSDSQLKDTQSKLTSMTAERDRLTTARDQLETEVKQWKTQVDERDGSIKQWKAAVDERDRTLKQQNDRIQQDVSKYNDLMNRYNALVNQVNTKAAGGH